MKNCPECQHSLPSPEGGRRWACGFCGWVQAPSSEAEAELEPLARTAEEIARQRQLKTEPVWRWIVLVLGVLTLLILAFNTLSSAFKKAKFGPAKTGAQQEVQPAVQPSGEDKNLVEQSVNPSALSDTTLPIPTTNQDSNQASQAANQVETGSAAPADLSVPGSGLPSAAQVLPGPAQPSLTPSGVLITPPPDLRVTPPSGVLITPPPRIQVTPQAGVLVTPLPESSPGR